MIRPLLLALATLSATAAGARADIAWGLNGHPLASYPGVSIDRQLDYLADLGARSYRVDISGLDQADGLAEIIEKAKPRGIEVLPVVTPGIDYDKTPPAEVYDKARALTEALGKRFKNDVRVWELGNELENYAIIRPCEMRMDGTKYPCEWGPAEGSGPLHYYGPRWEKVSAALKGMSDGMIAVDPTIRKAMGTAGWGHTGAFELMQRDGIQWDISVWHLYGDDPEWAFKVLKDYGHPIWVTEFNNRKGSQGGDDQQSDGLKAMMERLEELSDAYDVEAGQIYELLDQSYLAPDSEAYYGLVRLRGSNDKGWSAGEPKPAYLMLREMLGRQGPSGSPKRDCDLAKAALGDSPTVRQVGFAYCLVLGRAPDGGGLEGWAQSLESKSTTVASMLDTMVSSDEFTSRFSTYAMTNAEYVQFLYRTLLGRDADGDGLAAYASDITKGKLSRDAVAEGLIGSDEFRAKYPDLFAS